jgi:hypothetical protein
MLPPLINYSADTWASAIESLDDFDFMDVRANLMLLTPGVDMSTGTYVVW